MNTVQLLGAERLQAELTLCRAAKHVANRSIVRDTNGKPGFSDMADLDAYVLLADLAVAVVEEAR